MRVSPLHKQLQAAQRQGDQQRARPVEANAIIRQSDEPKAALIERFRLSDRQAEDILEIRLRQLARLEAIKIEQELSSLRDEQAKLEEVLANPSSLRRLMVKEIESDAK